MDKITQQQNDVYFDSETKYVQSLPWTVKLQPNIYGGEGKNIYIFLKRMSFRICIYVFVKNVLLIKGYLGFWARVDLQSYSSAM